MFALLKGKKGIAVVVGVILIIAAVVTFGAFKGRNSEQPSED